MDISATNFSKDGISLIMDQVFNLTLRTQNKVIIYIQVME